MVLKPDDGVQCLEPTVQAYWGSQSLVFTPSFTLGPE